MNENKIKYYEMAKSWTEEYLKDRDIPIRVKFEAGEVMDDIHFLNVSLERLINGKGAEQRASYERIRKFKNIIEKSKTFVAQIK